jgi:hypothetical protein
MRIKEGFFLKHIQNVPYLLPYGNRIASFEHGVQLVGSGAWIAGKLLEGKDVSREELLKSYVAEYKDVATEEELSADLDTFLDSLERMGLLEQTISNRIQEIPGTKNTFSIAGIRLGLFAREELVHPLLQKFACEDGKDDVTIRLAYYEQSSHPIGRMLVRSRDVVIYEKQDGYGILYPENHYVRELNVSRDGASAVLYLKQDSDAAVEEVFLAMRSAFLVFAQSRHLVALHCVSVKVENGVVLFSGVSGAGKSTHSKLWEQQFGYTILNGDLNLLGMEKNSVVVHGIPWCGTSEIATPFTEPLLGVFFIHQSWENRCEDLVGANRTLALSNRFISPTWTKELYEKNLEFATRAQEQILLSNLYCTVDAKAAEVSKEHLRTYLEEKDC